MKSILIITSCLLVLTSCGSGSSDGSSDSPRFNINTQGGTVEKSGIATIEFQEDTFAAESSIFVYEETKEEIIDDYEEGGLMFDAGLSAKKYLRITSTLFPRTDLIIHYTVPHEFIDLLGSDFRPRLFVVMFQSGANGEMLNNFEPLDSNLQSDILTATIPKEAFIKRNSGIEDLFEAVVIIGSSPASRVDIINNVGGKALDLKLSQDDVCNGVSIGNPLDGDLRAPKRKFSLTVKFHPTAGLLLPHYGVDLPAADGENVFAVSDGTIEKIAHQANIEKHTGWGWYIILKHTDGSKTLYAHLLKDSMGNLVAGSAVNKGDVIAKADTSGFVTGPHLHLEYTPSGEIFNSDEKIDPYPCLNASFTGQITLSDNGILADDSFSLTLDGKTFGTTAIGGLQNFAINNLRQGDHTIIVEAVVAPDDVGTLQITLGDGVAFSDGTNTLSLTLREGSSATHSITVDSRE